MHHVIILNPFARNGRAGKQRALLAAALQRVGLSFEIWQTEGPGHGVELAQRAAEAGAAVVAAGGDGTIQEVSRGVIENGSAVPLGVIPMGTGNDFVKMLGMPKSVDATAQALAKAVPRAVDYGLAHWWEEGERRSRPFMNAMGAGFDAAVARRAASLKYLPGITGYLAAVVRTLRQWEGPTVLVRTGSVSSEEILYEGPLLLVTVANGVSSGGTFYLTPDASIIDGHLDVCVVEQTSPRRILQVLPKAMKGRHVAEREVHTARVIRLQIEAETGLPVHADGELLAARAQRIEVDVVPGGLTILMPSI